MQLFNAFAKIVRAKVKPSPPANSQPNKQYAIEVLVSTMNEASFQKLVKKMNISTKTVIVNQISEPNILPIDIKEKKLITNSYHGKGLSKSRNQAISLATSDICVIADDDMYYERDYESTIQAAYKEYPDADIIAFHVADENLSQRKDLLKSGRVDWLHSMKLSSVQLTFKKTSLTKIGISFNEQFGAGTELFMGEENIFLSDCIKKGLKVYYVPVNIATLKISESTWFTGYDSQYFKVKGRVYYQLSRILSPLLILQFAYRKRFLYSKRLSATQAVRYMFIGAFSRRYTQRTGENK